MNSQECAQCGKPLAPKVGPGRPPAYCSLTCKAEAARERERHWRVLGQLVEQRAIKEEI